MTDRCVACERPLAAGAGYCEACGHRQRGSAVTRWVAEVTADAARHARMGMSDIPFPERYPPRRFVVGHGESTIGRRSVRRGIEPDIDLSGAPEDPAVSHLQAVLIVADDGSCWLVDLGSTNGTWLAGADEPLEHDVPVPLRDGSTFHVGAWTAITVRCDDD